MKITVVPFQQMENFERNVIYVGHVLDVLRKIPSESIDAILFSPPYYGKRDYTSNEGIRVVPEIIWDGDPDCKHDDWIRIEPARKATPGDIPGPNGMMRGRSNDRLRPGKASHSCSKCGAWKGDLGNEPTFGMYIAHISVICDECYRVLKPWGCFMLNQGDGYGGSGGPGGDWQTGNKAKELKWKPQKQDYPDQCLFFVPQRTAIELVDHHGWCCHNDNIWHKCLAENTLLFTKQDDGDYVLSTIKEMFGKKEYGFIPTMGIDRKIHWVKIKTISPIGVRDTVIITTKTGRMVEATNDHKFPFKINYFARSDEKFIRLKIKNNLSINDHLFINSELDIDLLPGTSQDYSNGFVCGFFIAEGNFGKRRLMKKIGHQSKIKYACFSCGKNDEIRGYLKYLDRFKINKYYYGNSITIHSFDKELISMITRFIIGNKCDEKSFTKKAFNQSIEFIRGCVDGFLAGDGCYDEENGRWRIGIKPNLKLKNELEVMCRILHYDFRFESISKVTCINPKNREKKIFDAMKLVIRKKDERVKTTNLGFCVDKIKNIISSKAFCYDLEIEPLYPDDIFNALGKRKARYNHLFFLANGIWSHNSDPQRESVITRFTNDHEYVWFFSKQVPKKPYFYVNRITHHAQREKPPCLKTGVEKTDWYWGKHIKCDGKGCKDCKDGLIKKYAWIPFKFYFNQMMIPKKHPNVKGSRRFGGNKAKGYGNPRYSGNEYDSTAHEGNKNMTSTWEIATSKFQGGHYACWPVELAALILDAICPREICTKCRLPRIRVDKIWSDCGCGASFEKGVALDAFVGAGTTHLAGDKIGVDVIGIELNPEYAALARQRINHDVPEKGQSQLF